MPDERRAYLDRLVGGRTPGLQYVVVNTAGTVFEYNAGWADIRNQRPFQTATTLCGYSLSKTVTAAAVFCAIEAGAIGLDDRIAKYFSALPYSPDITIRHLLAHSSGIPNPLPLRWVHPAPEHGQFDEKAALEAAVRRHSHLRFRPGEAYLYSNIGYWLLGAVLERACAVPFADYVRDHICRPLAISPHDLSYAIPNTDLHACGYLEKYSAINLFKPFLIDRELIGGYDGRWLRIEPHYVNGPSFGGVIGTACGIARFLRDQLQDCSVLFGDAMRSLFYQQQKSNAGTPLPMTLGWHIGGGGNARYFFKEGGGGGFHCMMRLYRESGIASVVWSNATRFDVRACMDSVDRSFQ